MVGDRFVCDERGRAFDLATSGRVWLEERRAADAGEMRRWTESSGHLMARWHCHLSPLIDAFALAEDRFLVAHPYAPERPGAGEAAVVRTAAEGVEAFLGAERLRVGEALADRARLVDGVVKIQPGGVMGEEDVGASARGADGDADGRERSGDRRHRSLGMVGGAPQVRIRNVRIKRRPRRTRRRVEALSVGVRLGVPETLTTVMAALECLGTADVAPLFVSAARGAGFTTFLAQAAREIRRLGMVPVSVAAWRRWPEIVPLLAGRTVVLMADRGGEESSGRELRCAISAWGASHARLAAVLAHVEPGHACAALSLPPMALGDLSSRIWLSDARARRPASLFSLVRRAEGLPGVVVERLLASPSAESPRVPGRADWGAVEEQSSWAAESGIATFPRSPRVSKRVSGVSRGAEAFSALARVSARARRHRDVPGDPLSDRLGLGPEAEALVGRRRWAAASRWLHRDIAAHARRGERVEAARAAMALGRVRLSLADVPSAVRWLREAAAHALACGADEVAAQAVAWQGLAHVEDGEMEEGERRLRCAWMAARHAGHRALARWVRLGLARCLYWQGRFADMPLAAHAGAEEREDSDGAAGASPGAASVTASGDTRVAAERLELRVHLARGQLGKASTLLSAAARRVETVQNADAAAAVDGEAARLHLLIGDLDACDRYLRDAFARRCVRSRLLRLYLILYLRLMRDSSASSRHRRERLAQTLLRPDTPRLLRIRARYWIEQARGRRSTELQSFITRYGEAALAGGAVPQGGEPMWDDLQTLLQISHEATDERDALARVCGHLRERIGAARVAVHAVVDAAEPASDQPLVFAGSSRLASGGLARRVIDTGVSVPVSSAADAVEAAVPVRYGRVTLGAVVVRWTVGAKPDERLVTMLLMTAAAIAAPMLQAFRDRFASAPPSAPEAIGGSMAAGVASLLGGSVAMIALRETVRRAAAAPFHVLIHGESGSGKELVARALHHHSARRHRRFCAINCAALTDELFESEMFGHARGAFTGALVERQGIFEEADGGTLFLDEVGELTRRGQAKLLRVMQDGEVRRVGENLSRRVDARIVSATNRVLKEDAERGEFRADLLYRLDVIHLDVPPLRERREDIPLLARAFWEEAARKTGSRATLAPDTVAALARYDWPGNVRELQNALMALAAQVGPRGRVGPGMLAAAIAPGEAERAAAPVSFVKARRAFEARIVRAALLRAGGAHMEAARELGLTRQGLGKIMARLRIEAIE